MQRADAVVVGSGPNGLAAALTLARAGLGVEVFEGAPTLGGGTRTEALTLEGFRHDVCSAVHPALVASPFFRSLDLAALGVVLRQPELAFAHPLGGGRPPRCTGTSVRRPHISVATPRPIATWWGRWWTGSTALCRTSWGRCAACRATRWPWPASPWWAPRRCTTRRGAPRTDAARALLAGTAAHSMEPLTAPLTSAFGLLLTALGHGAGWPVVEGGSAAITKGMADELRRLGGVVHTGAGHLTGRSPAGTCGPARHLAAGSSSRWPAPRLSRRAGRPWARFRPGWGTCKVDWALDGPVPWRPRPAGAR